MKTDSLQLSLWTATMKTTGCLQSSRLKLDKADWFIKFSRVCSNLMRGEVFEIEGAKVFCMGGASSHDKHCRKLNVSWWEEEIPSHAEFEHAVSTLEKHNWCVDYIVTHCAPKGIQAKIANWYENDAVTSFLQFVEENCRFKHWYFGHYHVDLDVDEKHTALYNRIIPFGGGLQV